MRATMNTFSTNLGSALEETLVGYPMAYGSHRIGHSVVKNN